jgi:hypothetical protein
MALEAAFCDLAARLGALREELIDLRTTVLEDKPLHGDAALVDVLADAIDDVLGWIEEALTDATTGRQAVEDDLNVHRARRALVACQERYLRIMRRWTLDLLSYDHLAELMRFGRRRGREWRAWTESASSALAASHRTIFDVQEALCRCWQELAEGVSLSRAHLRQRADDQTCVALSRGAA